MATLAVHLLPRFVPAASLVDSTTIVVDLLRASTTICHALAAGAQSVMPFVEVEETLAAANKYGRQSVVLGGERGGVLIEGFDLGNSPTEYTKESVGGRRVLFTTTNGAKALHHARESRRVYVGAAANLSAVAAKIRGAHSVNILCAGTGDDITREDILAAGAIVDAILADQSYGAVRYELRHHAASARQQWRSVVAAARTLNRPLADAFALELHDTTGGANLVAINHESDIDLCARIDVLTIVPEFNPATNEIRPA